MQIEKTEKMIDLFEMSGEPEPALDNGAGSVTVEDASETAAHDPVHRPKHYQGKSGSIQAISVIEEFELNYNLGNVCKYLLRAGKKNEKLEDLQKMLWYTCREIKCQGKHKELKEFFEKQLKEI